MIEASHITAPFIPESYIKFAHELAELAEKHGITKITTTLQPRWEDMPPDINTRITGDITISYSSEDGRGRPVRNLGITLSSNTNLRLISNPDTY